MNFLDFIPSEIIEVLISYLEYDDFISLYNIDIHLSNLNYKLIYKYRKDIYDDSMTIEKYREHLGLEDIKHKLNLNYDLNDIKHLKSLRLDRRGLKNVPNSVREFKELQGLYI